MDRRVTLLLFLSLLFSGARASVVSLSLKESEQRFSEHNLEVIAERYNIDIAEAQVVQAKLFENPVVSLEQNVYNRLNGHYFRETRGNDHRGGTVDLYRRTAKQTCPFGEDP